MVFVGLRRVSIVRRGRRLSHQSTHIRRATVVAHGNLGLVGIDKDARVPRRTAAAVANDSAAVRPRHGLLMNQLHGRVRCRLRSVLASHLKQRAVSIQRCHPYLQAELGLLESRPRHGLFPRPLVRGPDADAVRRLRHHFLPVLFHLLYRLLGLGHRGDGDLVQLPRRGREGPAGDAELARQPAGRPQS